MERNRAVFRLVDDRSAAGDEELLTVSHLTGVTKRSEKDVNMFMAESLEGYKRCEPGDLVVNTMWAWMGALGISPHAGIVSPSYHVYRLREPEAHEPRYFDYLFRTPAYVAELTRHSRGVWTSRLRIYPDEFFDMEVWLPPLSKQRAIADFLDRKTAAIDALIEKKQKLLDLLAEKRAALINQAVTKGLDPTVPLKDSGIPGIGPIPAHWRVSKVKFELTNLNYRRIPLSTTERSDRQGEYPYYGASGVIDYIDDYLFDETTILVAEEGLDRARSGHERERGVMG